MSAKRVYLVVTEAGHAWPQERRRLTSLQDILMAIYEESQSKTGYWDRPDQLLVDGVTIVWGGLSDIAWEFGAYSSQLRRQMEAALSARAVEIASSLGLAEPDSQ